LRRSWVTLTVKKGLIGATRCPFPSFDERKEEEIRWRRRRRQEEKEGRKMWVDTHLQTQH